MTKTRSTDSAQSQENSNRCCVEERTDKFVMVSFDLLERGRFLTVAAKWLYVVLRSFRNEKTGATFPTYEKIMRRGGLSRNAVAKGLAELEHFGWIERVKTEGKRTLSYKFSYPTLVNENNEEFGDQTFPTQKNASEWAKIHRRKSKNKF